MKRYLVSLDYTWAVFADTPEKALEFIKKNGVFFTVESDFEKTGAYEDSLIVKVLDGETEEILLVDE